MKPIRIVRHVEHYIPHQRKVRMPSRVQGRLQLALEDIEEPGEVAMVLIQLTDWTSHGRPIGLCVFRAHQTIPRAAGEQLIGVDARVHPPMTKQVNFRATHGGSQRQPVFPSSPIPRTPR